MDGTPRAKPLNALTLAALPVGAAAWDDEIQYLESTLSQPLHPDLRQKLTAKRDALVRARDWLLAKVQAETHHRIDQESTTA